VAKRAEKATGCVEEVRKIALPTHARKMQTRLRLLVYHIMFCRAQPKMKAKVLKSEVKEMLKTFLCTKRCALIAVVCVFACAISGCLESSFRIASESRLPRGIAIPPGLTRADVSVTLDYIGISRATFTVRDKTGKKLTTVTGKTKGDPRYLRTTPQSPAPRYPVYVLIVINGVTEIMEHRQPGDIIYITDDPAIREELLSGRGVK